MHSYSHVIYGYLSGDSANTTDLAVSAGCICLSNHISSFLISPQRLNYCLTSISVSPIFIFIFMTSSN